MSQQTSAHRGYRSLFWPIVLISVGLVVLLGNLGVIGAANIVALLRMWPLLLIVIGLDLLFGRSSPILGGLIGIGAVVVAILIMLVGPSLGLAGNWTAREFTDSVALGEARSARVELDLAVGHSEISSAIADRGNLLEADLTYLGPEDAVKLDVSGENEKAVHLRYQGEVNLDFSGIVGWFINPEEELRWDIRLNPDVPLDLNVSGGAGSVSLDLQDMSLSGLNLSGGFGAYDLTLPATERRYDVRISGGAGSANIDIPDANANLDLTISGGLGGITIDVHPDAAVRLDVSGGIGSVDVPAGLERVSGGDDRFGNEGVWETPDFDDAGNRIVISYDGGVGGLTVR